MVTGAEVRAVVTDDRGRPIGVRYITDGGQRFQPAKLVILAAAAVQNARLLLLSQSPQHPQGLGNARLQVGRGFVPHLIANVHGLFDETTENWWGLSAPTLWTLSDVKKDRGPDKPFGSVIYGLGPAIKPNDLLGVAATRPDLYGAALDAFIQDAAHHMALVNGLCETVANPANQISLSDRTDANGLPLARVHHTADAEALALCQYAKDTALEIMRDAGAHTVWPVDRALTSHAAGGTVMGTDPQDSVTDGFGRVHDMDNLVIGGGGLLPSISGGSPTFTLLAMANRTAADITARPGAYGL